MRIRIFRATTLAEAMSQVRDELGLEALILSTANHSGIVEVTAALEPEDEPDPVGPAFEDSPFAAPRELVHLPSRFPPQASRPPDPLCRHNLPSGLLSLLQRGPLEDACSRTFRFTRLPLDADGSPLLLAGPPGAGKTLTVAKLATRLVMEGYRPLVITADEQRAGAVEQLAAFTRLLGLTLIAAGRPETLARTLGRREPLSPVLIDAPGLDLMDPAQEDRLAGLAAASHARIGLVLPAGLDPIEATEVAAAHAAQGADLMIATRVDRSARLGGILAAAHAADLALTEAGTGSSVADGLTHLSPAVIASRLIGSAPCRIPGAVARPAPAEHAAPPGKTLALHIAAQASTHRLPSRKTNP